MNETLRHEIVQRHQAGASVRAIARELGISRGAVTRVLQRLQAQRDGTAVAVPRPKPRPSIIDPFEPILQELLAKYPNLTNERALEVFCFSRNRNLPWCRIAYMGHSHVTVVVGSEPGVARAASRAACLWTFLLSRASANFRSRSAKMVFSFPSSLAFGVI